MKYGETIFDIGYLLFIFIIGLYIIRKGKNKTARLMGIATLVLGLGDSFHLVPRVLNYFIEADYTVYLGYGKLITSITMTIFYVLLYYVYKENYEINEKGGTTVAVWLLTITRIILCLFPQNTWGENSSPLIWSILRNIPFFILGILITHLFYQKRFENKTFQYIWLYIILSFMFYTIVVLGASTVPMLGMFMIPKTICYMLMVWSFKNKIR